MRIRHLPSDTQEGLLHQTLEKFAKVTRTEFLTETREAVVELANAAVRLSLPTRISVSINKRIRKQASCCCGQSQSFLMVSIWRYLKKRYRVRCDPSQQRLLRALVQCSYRVQRCRDQERVWGVHANLVLLLGNLRLVLVIIREGRARLEGKDRMISERC